MELFREMVLEFIGDDEQVIFFDSPSCDEAIIGLSENNKVIYDHNKMVKCLMNQENWTAEEAIEFIDVNLSCLTEKGNFPIIVRLF